VRYFADSHRYSSPQAFIKRAIKARNLNITTFGIDDIGLGTEKIGIKRVSDYCSKSCYIVSERPPVKMSEGHNEASLVDSLIANFKAGGNVLEKKEKAVKKEIDRPDFPEKDFRDGARGILTWAEVTNGKISRPSLELLTPARNLATQLGNGTKVMTLIIGKKRPPFCSNAY